MRTNTRTPRRLRVRRDALRLAGRDLGADTDYALADTLTVDPASLSMLMTGRRQPSARFIAEALGETGRRFEDLFEVVDDVPAAVAA